MSSQIVGLSGDRIVKQVVEEIRFQGQLSSALWKTANRHGNSLREILSPVDKSNKWCDSFHTGLVVDDCVGEEETILCKPAFKMKLHKTSAIAYPDFLLYLYSQATEREREREKDLELQVSNKHK